MNTLLKTTRHAALIACGCATIALSGCAEVTFKRGAGPGEMQATEQGCRANSADVEAYKACLHAAGFIYAKPTGDSALFAEDEPDAEAAVETSAATVNDAQAPSTTPTTSNIGGTASDAAPTVSIEPSGRAGQSLPKAAPAKTQVTTDPLKQVTVASWWKLGGTAGGLEADQASCATALGDAYRVAPNAKVITVGMLRCLKGKGWFAVGR